MKNELALPKARSRTPNSAVKGIVQALAVFVGLLPAFSEATPITYTSRASFETATGGSNKVYDFTDALAPDDPKAFVINDAVFDLNTLSWSLFYEGMRLVVDSSDAGQAFAVQSDDSFRARNYLATLQFDSPQSAIGFDFVADTDNPFTISFGLLGSSTPFGATYTLTGSGFFGLIFDPGIYPNYVSLAPWSASDTQFVRSPFTIDNVTVPEPSTLALVSGGLLAVAVMRRRTRGSIGNKDCDR